MDWEIATTIILLSIDETLSIIDDGLCMGFEFKIDNGLLYYKEID